MKLHSVFVSYHRIEILKRALNSYLETVSVPFSLVVVDNGSKPSQVAPIAHWLLNHGHGCILLGQNMYPGFACNRGWELAPEDADFFHRADNDFAYREGWCEEVRERFSENPELGQLGLMLDEEEGWNGNNTGGNCVIRRELWDAGLRWDERPWPEIAKTAPGWTEDSFFSPAVREAGWEWGRVKRKVIDGLTSPDPADRYYRETYRARGIYSILRGIE